MGIRVKRIYEDQEPDDGKRVLVDRLWPRGVSKEEAELDMWMKSVAPSEELRQWFDHDSDRWEGFKDRYRTELEDSEEEIQDLLDFASSGTLTLLYAARDEEHNNAVVLREYLDERLGGSNR